MVIYLQVGKTEQLDTLRDMKVLRMLMRNEVPVGSREAPAFKGLLIVHEASQGRI